MRFILISILVACTITMAFAAAVTENNESSTDARAIVETNQREKLLGTCVSENDKLKAVIENFKRRENSRTQLAEAMVTATNPGLIAQCDNAPVPGSLQCNIATNNYGCRFVDEADVVFENSHTASDCATFYSSAGSETSAGSATKCPDGPISWRGFYYYGTTAYWSLCFSWQYIATKPGYTVHGRDGISSKAVVGHDSRMSSGAGYLVSKRMKCTGNDCKVYKSGLCIDLKDFTGTGKLSGPPYSTPFALKGDYVTYGGTRTTGRQHAETLELAKIMFAKGAEKLLKYVQGLGIPVATLPAAYRCSETVVSSWNENSGSDASQGTKAIGIF